MILLKPILFKIYYNCLYYYKNLFIKRKQAIYPKIIDVLCRGDSLKFFTKIKRRNNANLIILANFEKNDICNSKILDIIKNIPITIVSNISEPIPKLSSLKSIYLDEVFISRISDGRDNKSLYLKRNNFRLNSISRNVKFINSKFLSIYNNINVNSEGNWNTGLFSLFIACTKNPNEINLYGMDFFETDYFNGGVKYKLSNIEINERSIEMVKSFKKTFDAILKFFPNIKFTIYTKSKITSNFLNVKINLV
tara:strand:- start:1913 stop:2665 length:753 start_codon:yes stop_codon:yes gene_type:complete